MTCHVSLTHTVLNIVIQCMLYAKKMHILSNDSQLFNKSATKYPIFCYHAKIHDL